MPKPVSNPLPVFSGDNCRDYEELPDYLKEGLEVHFVRTFDDTYRTVF